MSSGPARRASSEFRPPVTRVDPVTEVFRWPVPSGAAGDAQAERVRVMEVTDRFRWLEGLKVRLRLLEPDGIKPDGTARDEILLEANNANAEIDNLEALALSTGEDGETVITLMSDDNFNRFLQRTLLLQFTLKDEPAEATAEAGKSAKK